MILDYIDAETWEILEDLHIFTLLCTCDSTCKLVILDEQLLDFICSPLFQEENWFRNELRQLFQRPQRAELSLPSGSEAVRLCAMAFEQLEVEKTACVRASAQLMCLLGPSV